MKTNQLMQIAFVNGCVDVQHKTGMGDLSQLWNCGNAYRVQEDNGEGGKKGLANLTSFLSSKKTKAFIATVKSHTGDDPIMNVGRGNKKKTLANIHMMIYAAEYLSTEFHFEVIDTFIKGKILDFRDESGDEFKAMNVAITTHLLGGRTDKSPYNNIYQQVAKEIKAKIQPKGGTWNTATGEDLRERLKVEEKLTEMLDLDLVKDPTHLRDIIEKMR